MAKRKPRRRTPQRVSTGRSRPARRTPASKRQAARSTSKRTRAKAPKTAHKKIAKKAAPKRTATSKKTVAPKRRTAKRPVARQAAARKKAAPSKRVRVKAASTSAPSKASKTAASKAARFRPPTGKSPALNRERRTIAEEDPVPGPPSSLDLDRSASAFRSGRRNLRERYDVHTETGPALTGGDVDADWESAYSVGDEAPGGDSPTPDQDVVEEIGQAVGINYEDNEELGTEKKITERDRHRWELDPASSDDFEDR